MAARKTGLTLPLPLQFLAAWPAVWPDRELDVVKEFMAHCHAERFHQGLGGQLIARLASSLNQNGAKGKVVCRSPLGGMLTLYHREAA